jgi:prepilin-type N-terminal cleavage/methylation domain-containing protein
MKLLNKFKKRQSGFTLVELGIVVAIGAVIIGIGLIVVPSLLASTRANGEVAELPAIATKISRAYANQPNFSTLTHANVVGLQVFPDNQVSGTTVTNRWGGTVTVASIGATGLVSAHDAFTITSTGVPSDECVQLGQGLERAARVISVTPKGGAATSVKADGAKLDLGALGTACKAATSATMVYTFGK